MNKILKPRTKKLLKGKITISLHISMIILAFLLFIPYVIFHLHIEKYAIFSLLRDICGMMITSVCIGAIMTYSDLADVAGNVADSVKQENENALDTIQQKLDKLSNAFDYVEHVEHYPLHLLSDESLMQLIESAGAQKIKLLSKQDLFLGDQQWKEGFLDLSQRYLDQFSNLQQGKLYRNYQRKVTLTPASEKKIIGIQVILQLTLVPPSVTKDLYYDYKPRFKSREDAESARIKAINNEKDIRYEGGEITSQNDTNYIRKYKIKLENNNKNNLTIINNYIYHLDKDFVFSEAYYMPNPSCEFSCKFSVNGPEADKWHIKIDNYMYQVSDGDTPNLDIKENPIDKTIEVTKDNATWFSEGITYLSLSRKE